MFIITARAGDGGKYSRNVEIKMIKPTDFLYRNIFFMYSLLLAMNFHSSLVLLEPMRTYEPFFWDAISAWMPVFKRLKSDSATFTIGKVFP